MVNVKKILNKSKFKDLTPKSIIRLSGVGNQQHTGRPRKTEKKVLEFIKNEKEK